MKMNRVMAIAEKDFKEFMRNMMLLTMPILPIAMALLFTATPIPKSEKMDMVLSVLAMSFVAVLTGSLMTMIAEEKEKQTLRGLINSPASMMEVFFGKSIVVTIILLVTISAVLFIFKINIFTNIWMVVGFIILYIFYLLLGSLIGLHVKSVSETSLYFVPVLFIFGMNTTIANIGIKKDNILIKLNEYMPMMQYSKLEQSGDIIHIIIIAIWLIVTFVCTYMLYRKNSID
ncbi:ABC transporter permease [Macrococcoides goetzii]|uniref:ABC transporter permease n=1 Tax=Macrococcus TaxID=69965 RepID=UPI001EF1D35B|nr:MULTISPECIES: ABC transporter permease [Macrococcus]MCG7419135.1 ABC transporter permease [Macrococcus epidermidis]MCH4985846.1 hypothetical protein [Macrococcus sp. PK]